MKKRRRVGKPFYIHARIGLCHCSLEATANPVVIGPQGWWLFDGCNNKLLASGKQRAVDFLREFCPRLKPGEQLRVRIVVEDVRAESSARNRR